MMNQRDFCKARSTFFVTGGIYVDSQDKAYAIVINWKEFIFQILEITSDLNFSFTN